MAELSQGTKYHYLDEGPSQLQGKQVDWNGRLGSIRMVLEYAGWDDWYIQRGVDDGLEYGRDEGINLTPRVIADTSIPAA